MTEPLNWTGFVWTRSGRSIHVSRPEPYEALTYCGRPVDAEAGATDVLANGVCEKCRRTAIRAWDAWRASA